MILPSYFHIPMGYNMLWGKADELAKPEAQSSRSTGEAPC
jgi:hypothetical protein